VSENEREKYKREKISPRRKGEREIGLGQNDSLEVFLYVTIFGVPAVSEY
jgi:hypothetical protein